MFVFCVEAGFEVIGVIEGLDIAVVDEDVNGIALTGFDSCGTSARTGALFDNLVFSPFFVSFAVDTGDVTADGTVELLLLLLLLPLPLPLPLLLLLQPCFELPPVLALGFLPGLGRGGKTQCFEVLITIPLPPDFLLFLDIELGLGAIVTLLWWVGFATAAGPAELGRILEIFNGTPPGAGCMDRFFVGILVIHV